MRLVAPLLLACLLVGCGARTEVAKEKFLASVDSMLGELDVKRKQIDVEVDGLKKALAGIRKAKIKAEVKRDQIVRQADPVNKRIEETDQALAKLREHLTGEESVEINGETYSPVKLKEMADKAIAARKDMVERRDGLQRSIDSLDKVASNLGEKQRSLEERLTKMEGQIAEIDAKMIAVKAMREASETIQGDGDFGEKLASLEASVDDLMSDVEVEMRYETEKWDEADTTKQIDAVDEILSLTSDPTDTVAEINKILGTKE